MKKLSLSAAVLLAAHAIIAMDTPNKAIVLNHTSSGEFPPTLYSPERPRLMFVQNPASSPASFIISSENSPNTSLSWSISSIGSPVSQPSPTPLPSANQRALRYSQPMVGQSLIPAAVSLQTSSLPSYMIASANSGNMSQSWSISPIGTPVLMPAPISSNVIPARPTIFARIMHQLRRPAQAWAAIEAERQAERERDQALFNYIAAERARKNTQYQNRNMYQ